MSSPDRKKFRWGIVHATGRKGFTMTRIWLKRINRKIRIPIDLYPCRVEEKLTMKEEEEEPEKKGLKEAPEKGSNYELLSYTVSDSDSDLESTARSGPKCNKLEDTCESGVRPNT
ncbi:hypothetical protein Tco_1504770 [Tanacetum coccineum]